MLRLLVLLVLYNLLLVSASGCDNNGFIDEKCIAGEVFGKLDENTLNSIIKNLFISARNTTIGWIDHIIVNIIGPFTVCSNPSSVNTSNLLFIVSSILILSFLLILLLHFIYSIFGTSSRFSILDEMANAVITILSIILITVVLNYYATNGIFIKAKTYIVDVMVNFSFITMVLKTLETVLFALANLTLPLGPADARGIFAISFSQLFSIVFKSLDVIKMMFSTSILEYVFKLFLLCIGPRVIIEVILPIAALLRAFYFTRPGGNMLLGLSIAFVVVYPLIIYIYYNLYQNISIIWNVYFAESAYRMISGTILGLVFVLTPLAIKALVATSFDTIKNVIGIGNIINAINQNAQTLQFLGLNIGSIISILQLIPGLYFLVFGYLQLMVVTALILGPLALYLTVSLTGQISKALGTEINIAALSRLI